jgi:hypothetical protein
VTETDHCFLHACQYPPMQDLDVDDAQMTREQKVKEWLATLGFPAEDAPFAMEEALVVDEEKRNPERGDESDEDSKASSVE